MSRKLISAFVLAFAVSAAASAAETARYVVVLRDGQKIAGPDLASLGGRVLESRANRRVVEMPAEAVEALRRDPRVEYLQRLWNGVDEAPSAAVAAPARIVVQSDVPKWRTGEYVYDPSGNIKAAGADTYAYDAVGRLATASVSGKPQTYGYDAFGNLALNGNTADSSNNRLAGASYDAAGNVIADAAGTYRYDAVPSMTGYTPAASATRQSVPRRMIYGADDERIVVITAPGAESSSARITIRDFGGKVVREFEKLDVTEWRRDYVYAESQLVAEERQVPTDGNGYRHFHLDHLGSVRLMTRGGDAARIATPKYFPYGTEAESSMTEYTAFKHSPLEPMKFAGHERDYYGAVNVANDDYIDYMHARYYNPNYGRFLAVDPGRDWHPAEPQSWNRYAYSRNDPVNKLDPDGRYVVVAKNMREEVAKAYANSATFRKVYDAVHRDRSVIQSFTLGQTRYGPNRAETNLVGEPPLRDSSGTPWAKDSSGKVRQGHVLKTVIPPGHIGALIGHELQHGVEYVTYGSPANAPGSYKHSGGLETPAADAIEKQIMTELQQSKGKNKLTKEEMENLFDVDPGCAQNEKKCPQIRDTVDPGPATTKRQQ